MQEGALLAELKIGGGSLFAHRAFGTTYAAHSPELKVIALRAKIKYGQPLLIKPRRGCCILLLVDLVQSWFSLFELGCWTTAHLRRAH